jgi:hypothetical protein
MIHPSQKGHPSLSPLLLPNQLAIKSTLYPLFAMIKLWPSVAQDPQLTPRASANPERNPFDDLALTSPRSPLHHHHLLTQQVRTPDLSTPLASPLGAQVAALPTTSLSLHAPDFNMQPPPKASSSNMSTAPQTASTSSSASHGPGSSSKGQIHVKLIQARGLHVRSTARPYVVVQFEQNEFVSRDPTGEADKEVKGTPTTLAASNAMSALGAIGSKAAAAEASRRGSKGSNKSTNSSPASSVSSASALSNGNGLFGRISANNPVWKHEVSLFVHSTNCYCTALIISLQRRYFRGVSHHLQRLRPRCR